MVKGLYQHWKGGFYELLHVGVDEYDGKRVCIYRSLKTNKVHSRPLKDWDVEPWGSRIKRFTLVSQWDSQVQLLVTTLKLNYVIYKQQCAGDVNFKRMGGTRFFKYNVIDKCDFACKLRIINQKALEALHKWILSWE